MQSILQDLRFAARRLIKDRWFTLAAIAALALGIGANSAVFTLVNAVLLRGLPFDDADRIMMIDWKDTRGRNFGNSIQDFEDLAARQPDVFGDVGGLQRQHESQRGRPGPRTVSGCVYLGQRLPPHR